MELILWHLSEIVVRDRWEMIEERNLVAANNSASAQESETDCSSKSKPQLINTCTLLKKSIFFIVKFDSARIIFYIKYNANNFLTLLPHVSVISSKLCLIKIILTLIKLKNLIYCRAWNWNFSAHTTFIHYH